MILRQPFQVAGVEDQFDVNATVKGGGLWPGWRSKTRDFKGASAL